jgi:hypothetical protein
MVRRLTDIEAEALRRRAEESSDFFRERFNSPHKRANKKDKPMPCYDLGIDGPGVLIDQARSHALDLEFESYGREMVETLAGLLETEVAKNANLNRLRDAMTARRQPTVPPGAPLILELQHKANIGVRVRAMQTLADTLAGACMDAIEQSGGIVKAQIAERLHAALLQSEAWRQYVPPDKVPRSK